MRLLLLNTCGTEGSVALADTALDVPIVSLARMAARTASERLVGTVREAMAKAEWKMRDLAAIVVVTGPGSFTGVRVGLSVAKGLSEAGGVPLIAVSRLAMLADSVDGRVCAVLDAGRGEFYCGEFEGREEAGEALMTSEEMLQTALRASAVVVCEDAVAAALAGLVAVRTVAEPTAKEALPIALRKLQSGSFEDASTLDANYLRRTDAEIFAKSAPQRAG